MDYWDVMGWATAVLASGLVLIFLIGITLSLFKNDHKFPDGPETMIEAALRFTTREQQQAFVQGAKWASKRKVRKR